MSNHSSNTPRRDGDPIPFPPLPDPIPDPTPDEGPIPVGRNFERFEPGLVGRFRPLFRSLRHGCYRLQLIPNTVLPWVRYDGTMRVERQGFSNTVASGDLYIRQTRPPWWPVLERERELIPIPDPGPELPEFEIPALRQLTLTNFSSIPIFPRYRYRYYLRVTQILEGLTSGNSFTLGFERHRFNSNNNTWTNEGPFTAVMTWKPAPIGYPSPSDYLEGDLRDSNNAIVGRLTMGWVSSYLRRATLEIDRVAQSELPSDNGSGIDWKDVFDAVGWDVTVDASDSNLAEPSGQSWSDAELHQTMLARRDSANLDTEWRYHLLAVRRLDSTSRGIMYDAYGGDSNNIPREGAAISSHWTIPNSEPWGTVKGMRFGTADAPYFRTAVHEIGHAMGLYHNTANTGFMNTTGTIAASPGTFPGNITWAYAPDDEKRLKHMPDIWVRPGGIPFGQSYNTAPISPNDQKLAADGVELTVEPLQDTVPLGAPVRVGLTLTNTSDQPLPVPPHLSLKHGHVRGRVADTSGAVREFHPLIHCLDEDELTMLAPGDSLTHSMTLLRGPQGALFACAGRHRIEVDLEWELGGVQMLAQGESSVFVLDAQDEAHAEAAMKALDSPDLLLVLAVGGDHLDEGLEALDAVLDNKVLRPHYAWVQAKRLARQFGDRKPDLQKALSLLDDKAVLSGREMEKVADLVKEAKKGGKKVKETAGKVVDALKKKVKSLGDKDLTKTIQDL